MSNIHNTEIIEDAQSDFDLALSQRNWSECRTIIADLEEQGFEHEVQLLRHTMGRTIAHMNNEVEDMHSEDPRDVADRSYPRE